MFLVSLFCAINAGYLPITFDCADKKNPGVVLHLSMRPIESTVADRALLNQTYGAAETMARYQEGGPRQDIDTVRFPKYTKWTDSDGAVPWVLGMVFVDSVDGNSDFSPGEFLGHVLVEDEGDHSELSYVFIRKSWNRGIGTIAVKTLLKEAMPRLVAYKIPKIEATARLDNVGSWKLLASNGFIKVGEEHRYDLDPNVKDRLIYALSVKQPAKSCCVVS